MGPSHPFRGGIAAFTDRLASELKNEGHKVSIITFTLQYPGFLFPGKTQFSEDKAPELRIIRMLSSINPISWLKTGVFIRKEKPDILVPTYWMPFMAPALGTVCRITGSKNTKIISIVHNMLPHEKRLGDNLFSRYFSKSVDAFIGMSKSVINDIDKFNTIKPKAFCPHPLYDHFGEQVERDKALENLHLDPEYRYILFFGLIRDYKGLDWLLEAFSDNRLRKYKVKLLVAGEFYSDEEKYITFIKHHKLGEHVKLYSRFIPDAEVGNYFGAADLIAQPYKSATQSGVTQIGYHFEKPMLVTNVGGLAEIIPDGKVGYVVEPNPTAIADKLVDFFENNRASQFIEPIKEEKKKYAWSNMTRTIQNLDSELLK